LVARPVHGLALLGLEPAAAAPVPRVVHRGAKLGRPTQAVRGAPTAEFLNVAYSQEGEDLVLARLFGEGSIGVYVDVGAHHPLRFSNTHRLYLQGWRGVNVEPNPDQLALFERLRPGDVNVACGVSDAAGTLTYVMFNEPALNTFDAELAKTREGGAYRIVGTREIDVVPLADLLAQCLEPGTAIDLLTVDVEGLDLNVLRSNDWSRWRPRCVIAEALRSDVEAVLGSPLHAFLRAQGYRFFAKTFNSVFYLEHGFEV
jgi:FkbM family methyltransferase